MTDRIEFAFHLDFNPRDADHRQAATWLSAQPDPTEAVTRLIKAANTTRVRLQQWEDLATLLATEVRQLREQFVSQAQEDQRAAERDEDPESARRLDSMFG
jgi:hypothetical protein